MKYAYKLVGIFQRLHHSEEFEGAGKDPPRVAHHSQTWRTCLGEADLDKGAAFHFNLGSRDDSPAGEVSSAAS